ncbi:MAG: undecaprenyldiphospho-muramoylpentapeptide beta-N-acetylglucosaminyltransferase [Lewinellaceae bacterium]|nr:undecaprenyldiphospho-muramoylpentapeptide beta-N-acetylglucosaminyltransferase [Saprospiraceae bacterium]MCB9330974.1 undecaprenyldiphospho-muramoylpentapeptide beta-N-acetylglucosaminyltransferase [Lewinellaceae bacterium]
MARQLRILITGGGTGGHVFPAIAIADAIKALRPDAEFLFVGALGKMEMERVPQAGYAIEGLNIAGFQRGFSLNSILRNLSFPFKLFSSTQKAKRIIRQFKPDVVVGTGGYASGPVMRAAQQKNIPTVIQEQNSYAGVTNRLLAKNASRICVAYDGMEAYFPADRLVFTGNPVRQDILDLDKKRKEGLAYYNLSEKLKTVVVIGGSLGARTLNRSLAEHTETLAGHTEIQVLWQCGRFYENEYSACATAQLPNVQLRAFIDRMDLLYAAADLIVSRAGALSISELCLVGKPVILVPSPNVAEDHQTKNAMALVEKNAARLVRDAEAVETLLPEVFKVLENEALQFSLGENIRHLGKPKAASLIAETVLELAGGSANPVKTEN